MRNLLVSIVKKRCLSYTVVGIFFCLLAPASASEPTLQETIDFIQMKAQGSCKYAYDRIEDDTGISYLSTKVSGYTITLLDNKTILVKESIDEGRVRITEHALPDFERTTAIDETHWLSIWAVKVRLADLSTDVKIRIHGGMGRRIVVKCTKSDCLEWKETNRRKIKSVEFSNERVKDRDKRDEESLPDRQKSSSSYILFTVCDQEKAEKIKKALTHAIRISGGKDELF